MPACWLASSVAAPWQLRRAPTAHCNGARPPPAARRDEEEAAKALQGMQGRYYAGKPIVVEFSPVTGEQPLGSSWFAGWLASAAAAPPVQHVADPGGVCLWPAGAACDAGCAVCGTRQVRLPAPCPHSHCPCPPPHPPDVREGTCRRGGVNTGRRGRYCNFMHVRPVSRELRKQVRTLPCSLGRVPWLCGAAALSPALPQVGAASGWAACKAALPSQGLQPPPAERVRPGPTPQPPYLPPPAECSCLGATRVAPAAPPSSTTAATSGGRCARI